MTLIHVHPPLPVQVVLPIAITPRRSHTAGVFGCGSRFRVVVMFGGYKVKGYDTILNIGGFLSETTLLLLGE